ncbi:Transcriptional regulator, IclR family [Vibrio nigripulchritudo SOn1]|uniref:HTH-type transcriptional repressor AllR n=2 Tax=Vibrio nigripulchritudo TaxID=28173 RepID=A0AAV2VYX5_9VIBR|nr:Transcriptional regulator, IclR family [Vibrio nigripulchritudo SOn1]
MAEETKQTQSYTVPPVERAFRLLRYIGEGNRCVNISKASKALGINRTTLIRLIQTLQAEKMIEEISEGAGYQLGTGLIGLASEALSSRDIVRVSRPILRQLAKTLNLSSHLGVLDGQEIIYLDRETPNTHLVSNVAAGTRLPAHATSIGRILLANLPEESVRNLYQESKLEKFSDRTSTNIDQLLTQLTNDRSIGLAWSTSNFEKGIGSCAAPVFDHLGIPAGAINVSGPESAFVEGTQSYLDIDSALRSAATEISKLLGYSPKH